VAILDCALLLATLLDDELTGTITALLALLEESDASEDENSALEAIDELDELEGT
jgi:hypothetical protein